MCVSVCFPMLCILYTQETCDDVYVCVFIVYTQKTCDGFEGHLCEDRCHKATNLLVLFPFL